MKSLQAVTPMKSQDPFPGSEVQPVLKSLNDKEATLDKGPFNILGGKQSRRCGIIY